VKVVVVYGVLIRNMLAVSKRLVSRLMVNRYFMLRFIGGFLM